MKIDVSVVVNDHGLENNGDDHGVEIVVDDEEKIDVEDVDKAWEVARAKIAKSKRQKKIKKAEAKKVGKKAMIRRWKWLSLTTGCNEQIHQGTGFQNDYEDSKVEMNTGRKSDYDVVPKLLMTKERSLRWRAY